MRDRGTQYPGPNVQNDILKLKEPVMVHVETEYDPLLGRGWDRSDARGQVAAEVERVLAKWK